MQKHSDEYRLHHLPHLSLMGSFELRYEGQSVLIAPAGQRLLSLLVLSRRTLTREHVAERLWPDASGIRAAGCLRSALWRLPKLNQPLVVATPSTLQLSQDIETDLTATEDILRRAIAWSEPSGGHIPRRTPLPDVELADQALSSDLLPEAWDEWVIVERERLHQMRLHALESLACVHRSAGNFGQALDAALRAVAGEPLRESAHRQVIETYLAEGNTGEAIRHFRELRSLLRSELGLEPSSLLCRRVASAAGRDV
ncbi:transcriptional regulator, SARP family protein [Streptomyces bingchenggensis BCW-1]|uniref:Transcriptional regulator, SARP family protein n=1 Tax=Streptomyces bingchenggensis (strain BCW-1) TaxID=749414 RepID=D7BSQ3_STRBB|nr:MULTISPECIES: BTAD domain-containing putative transcriptional regulator [Streptomyces]ADI11550.1 transcriptional regulator, SARP family protein [Streptomyces bingchenggensis BCW-1]